MLATLAQADGALIVRLDNVGESLGITSLGDSYLLSSTHTIQNDSVNGVDSGHVAFNATTATITALGLAAYDTILIQDAGGASQTNVTFHDSGSNVYSDHFRIDLGHDFDVGVGEQSIVFEGNSHFNNVDLSATTTRNIVVNSGANITTTSGGLDISANPLGLTTGNFVGITVESGGRLAGRVTAIGTGGSGSSGSNHGVLVDGGEITSDGESVWVEGRGGGSGTASSNVGVFLVFGGDISAGGGGSVTVTGSGGGVAGTGGGNQGVRVQGGSAITSSGGAVQVTGVGGGSGSSVNNFGVYVFANGTIAAGGAGSVTIQGAGGGGSGFGNDGVVVDDVNSKITSGAGGIEVTGTPGGGTSPLALRVGSLGTISTALSNGPITLTGDRIAIDGTVNAGANSVVLKSHSNGIAVNLGGADAAGVLGLSIAELDRITAGLLVLGDANAGPITISQPIDPAATAAVSLITGANVSQSAPLAVARRTTPRPGPRALPTSRARPCAMADNFNPSSTSLWAKGNCAATSQITPKTGQNACGSGNVTMEIPG